MPKRENGQGLTANQEINLLEKAMSGDMVLVITPTTVDVDTTATGWTRDVLISLQTAIGEVHTWANLSESGILAVTEDGGGTVAGSPATEIALINGSCVVTLTGSTATWADAETDTLTVSAMTILGYSVAGGTSVETFNTPS